MDSRDPRRVLARSLRALREERWPGMKVTQPQLAAVLGGTGKRSVSVPLISSWESRTTPTVPPVARLEDYATFFATARSFDGKTGRLLSPDELTEQERQTRGDLAGELMRLRADAVGARGPGSARSAGAHEIAQSLGAGPWRYDDGNSITIVCALLPKHLLDGMPHTDRYDPEYSAMSRYADLDALFELHGHLRAANPTSQVDLRAAAQLEPDDHTAHLVSLGGVDWNVATSSLLDQLQLPVRQVANWDDPEGIYFEVDEEDGSVRYRPELEEADGRQILRQDVALFARAPNPFNRKRTVTICNGMYGSGSFGAVRALTDARFRDRNAEYLQEQFASSEAFCILTQVKVENGVALTPDWTVPEMRIFEWSRR